MKYLVERSGQYLAQGARWVDDPRQAYILEQLLTIKIWAKRHKGVPCRIDPETFEILERYSYDDLPENMP